MTTLSELLGGAGAPETFLGLPKASDAGQGKIVILGADCATPYTSVGAYCAGGADAIRAGSADYMGDRARINFDLGTSMFPEGVQVVDAGNLPTDEQDAEGNRACIRQAIAKVVAADAVPVLLGGDDSLPIPMLEALAPRGPLTILQIDAHIDWRDDVGGERWGLSSTMRRASEMAHVERIIQVGARGVGSAGPADLAAARAWGATIVPAVEMETGGLQAALDLIPEGAQVVVCFDCDALDPAIMPAVIAPTNGGLSYGQALTLIRGAAVRGRIVAFDMVEFMPANDRDGVGARTAAQLLTSVLGIIAGQVA